MTIGESLIVFMSIIIGLAVADLAFSLHRLLRRGRAIRWDWLMPALALVVLRGVSVHGHGESRPDAA